jgi:plasmid stabilization system protein ParE
MKNAVRKTSSAELDAAEIADWHEQQEPGLGLRFLDALDAAVAYIIRHSETPAIQFHDARRVRLHTFEAYAVFYVLRREKIIIFAVSDGRRNPRWIKRRRRQLG